ncbi:MAG: hypothetical protein ACI8W8_003853 [Rhodothermales bacterium]|jgi:hypothetical protein
MPWLSREHRMLLGLPEQKTKMTTSAFAVNIALWKMHEAGEYNADYRSALAQLRAQPDLHLDYFDTIAMVLADNGETEAARAVYRDHIMPKLMPGMAYHDYFRKTYRELSASPLGEIGRD